MKTLIFLLCSLSYLSQSQKTCYEPNVSQPSHSDVPCDPGAVVSACCSPGATCATNLYCISPLGARIVGTCTDKTFNDAACPWPLNKMNASTNFDHFNYKLNTTTCPDLTICPIDDPRCCSQGRGKVEILFHYNPAIPSAKSNLTSYYSAASYTTISLATTSQTGSSFAITVSTTSDTTTRRPSLTASSGIISSTKNSNKAIQPGVGASIGIAVALCVSLPLAIIVYSHRCRRRRNRNDSEQSSDKFQLPNERVATPNNEIAAAVWIDGLNELPDGGQVMAVEMDVRRQTNGGDFGLAELDVRRQTQGGGFGLAEMDVKRQTRG